MQWRESCNAMAGEVHCKTIFFFLNFSDYLFLSHPPLPKAHGYMNHQIQRNYGVIDYKFKKMKEFQILKK